MAKRCILAKHKPSYGSKWKQDIVHSLYFRVKRNVSVTSITIYLRCYVDEGMTPVLRESERHD